MDNFYFYKCKLGHILISSRDNSIVGVNFVDSTEKNEIFNKIENKSEVIKSCVQQLDEYFLGQRKKFDLKIEYEGTDFKNKVCKEVGEIPYGNVLTYKDIAILVGSPNAARAVSSVMHSSKISLIVPCHRVASKNGFISMNDNKAWIREWLVNHETKYK